MLTKPRNAASTPPLTLITSPAHRHLASPRHIEVPRRRFSDRPLAAKQHRAHRLASQAHMAEHAASLHACLPCSHIVSLVVVKSRFPYLSFLSFNRSFRFPFPPCPTVQAKRHRRLDLALAVAPLDTHSLPPQNNTDRFLDYIAVRDCRRRRTFPSSSFLYSQILRSILVLSQHRRHINTHRPPR